ncbi:MAG: hypothetical protein PHS44_08195 [Candidatus Dojkabacteria bacterium]|nr:hypothetical protein [Candidatus Dojkabacteria bacterium]
MKYLRTPKYYQDDYDLDTIKEGLDMVDLLKSVEVKIRKSKKLQHLSEEEHQHDFNYMYNCQMLGLKKGRFEDRQKTIEEWIERDRLLQDKYDNTLPPNVVCSKCGEKMKNKFKSLKDYWDDKPARMMFIFHCDKCNKREAYYENGEKYVSKPSLCPKCKSKLDFNLEKKGDITIWKTQCTSCKYREIEETNDKKEEMERRKQQRKEKELLKNYRNKFCLSEKEGNKLVSLFEEIAYANEVYKHILQEHEDPAYEKEQNIKKFSISELEKFINPKLEKASYKGLKLKDPDIGDFVEINFTTQDLDVSRNKNVSVKELERLLNAKLEQTNWRLMSGGITYRLGYLTGVLKGYERSEDILKLLGKKESEPKVKLDPEMEKKYGHSNAVQLAKLSAEFEARERIRRKRLKDEPDGFFLDGDDTDPSSYYTCRICHNTMPPSQTWWTDDGLTCIDCHRNIENGVIPAEMLKNDKIWFKSWHLKDEFDLHPATVRKFVRNGELVGRELKDEKGRTYETIFMAEDNVKFFKTHQGKGKRKQRWHYVDENGEVVWL